MESATEASAHHVISDKMFFLTDDGVCTWSFPIL